MPSAALAVAPSNPAKTRGLRRARQARAPCAPAAWTPLPDPVDALVVLALLTRVRAARVAGGEISASRLYDVRAFKSAVAELGYLRTLTRRRTGGTIVTSMPQLVTGLARLHPAWQMTGEKFADRDRHQQAVRRRLRDLDAMGLLRWRIGVDSDGEDARTELELRAAPDITADERAAATAALQRWQARYGPALNTGSTTGIRNAAGHARPLSASERQRRGIARTRQHARARETSSTNSAPRFAASTTSTNNQTLSTNPATLRNACGIRTGARAREPQRSGLGVTRHQASSDLNACAAVNLSAETASLTMGGSGRVAGTQGPAAWDHEALERRVAARLAARQPVWELIAAQSACRADEVCGWTLERGWPVSRLREAWVVWRHGSMCAGELGAAPAGHLEPDDPQRLRRALARYERHGAARPTGFPAGGLAVLAAIAAIAAERAARPQTLHFAIGLLDQLSRRMRAADTADDARRRQRAVTRARRRHDARPDGLMFAFRSAAWPAWVALDETGDPRLDGDELVLADRPGIQAAPDRQDPIYRQTLRDAQLLAGLWPCAEADGRTAMAANSSGYDLDDAHRRARPGPYGPPPDRRARSDIADLRLAQLAAIPLRSVHQLSTELRDQLLEQHTTARTTQRTNERHILSQRLAELGTTQEVRGEDA